MTSKQLVTNEIFDKIYIFFTCICNIYVIVIY